MGTMALGHPSLLDFDPSSAVSVNLLWKSLIMWYLVILVILKCQSGSAYALVSGGGAVPIEGRGAPSFHTRRPPSAPSTVTNQALLPVGHHLNCFTSLKLPSRLSSVPISRSGRIRNPRDTIKARPSKSTSSAFSSCHHVFRSP